MPDAAQSTTRRTPHQIPWYGWRKDRPDQRDLIHQPSKRASRTRLAPVEWRSSLFNPGVYNQGALGSCTANGIGWNFEFRQRAQGFVDYKPARLPIYWWERQKEGTINDDAGAEIRDGMDVVRHIGVPHEALFPYDIARFREQPSAEVYADAAKHEAITYGRVLTSTTAVKRALIDGPIVIGFTVYSSFESDAVARDGVVPIPSSSEAVVGGHCMAAAAWEKLKGHHGREYLSGPNSWDYDWGDKGWYHIPMSWICDPRNAGDFWAIQMVSTDQLAAPRKRLVDLSRSELAGLAA